MRRLASRRARVLAVAAVLALAVPCGARDLEVPETGEAALAQPMVVLAIGDRAMRSGKARDGDDLADLVASLPAVAVLDTGASAHVLSHASAERFGVEPESGSRYVETGMSGDHAMTVSRPVTLVASDLEPEDEDAPRRTRQRPAEARLSAQRLLLNEAPADLASALLSPGAMVDVVGMPLIARNVVEIEPADEAVAALPLRLRSSVSGTVDVWVPLTLVDFNRRHPGNRGPQPSLATNPVVEGIALRAGAARADGDWLLDTGAACSMISVATARRLGLVDATGKPTRPPDFTLPIGGIGGGSRSFPGFRLDRLALPTTGDRTLVFPDPAVVVHDITTTRADGTEVTLDGILGMNLLLPSGTGMTALGATRQLPAPFARVVLDVGHERLGLTLHR